MIAVGLVVVAAGAHALSRPEGALSVLCAGAVVAIGLPLSGDLDVIGFPLRMLSAQLAALVLPATGVMVSAAETVLVIEGNVADVEAPCAGLATLRYVVGAALGLSAWGCQRSVVRVVLAVGASVIVAVFGNATRVTMLAWLTLAAERPALAALVHVPLGVVVCVAALAAAAIVQDGVLSAIRRGGERGRRVTVQPSVVRTSKAVWVTVLAVCAVSLVARVTETTTRLVVNGPPVAQIENDNAVALSEPERALFGRHAERADKARLPAPLVGERIVVVASSLRAAHAPERCLASSGYRVDGTRLLAFDVDGTGALVKVLSLDGGARVGVSALVTSGASVAGLADLAWSIAARRDRRFAFVSAVVAVDGDDAERAHIIDTTARLVVHEARAALAAQEHP